MKNSKLLMDCENCRVVSVTGATDNATKQAFHYVANAADSASVITIKGNYTMDECKGILISGTAPIQIILDGTFWTKNTANPVLDVQNPNARIILKSGTRLISSGSTTITGVSGAKIYQQAGAEISGATTTATLLTTRPATWNF
jgi:hypothetical protein